MKPYVLARIVGGRKMFAPREGIHPVSDARLAALFHNREEAMAYARRSDYAWSYRPCLAVRERVSNRFDAVHETAWP